MVFSPSARQEESSGREAGPTIWKRVIRKFLTKQPRFRRALAPRAGEVFSSIRGDSGRAPFAALSRSQFLFHIIKIIMKVHGKALKPLPASLSCAPSPGLWERGVLRRRGVSTIPGSLNLFDSSNVVSLNIHQTQTGIG